MSLPRYQEYKDSGVEWLGEVPAHWGVAPLKRGFEVRLGKMLQPARLNEHDILAPYLRAANIQWNGVDLSDVKSMWFSARERDLLHLKGGDLLVSEGGDVGRSALLREEIVGCYFQNSVNRVRARGGDRTDYLYYWIATIKAKGYIDVLCNKSTIAHFTAEKVEAVPTPYPGLEEQRSIAAFLDRETTKIDALIVEQEKLLALLAEKRQATISHAVTRGLNPNAPLKDSGIPWLGEVPAHWEVKPLKRLARLVTGMTPPTDDEENYADEGHPWIRPEDLNESGLSSTASKFLSATGWKGSRHVASGASLICCIGSIGKVGFVDSAVATNQQITSAEFIGNGRYFYYATCAVRSELQASATGNVLRILNSERLGNVCYPCPNLEEQEQVAEFLGRETVRLDELAALGAQAIGLLKERRSALISAAVTGHIDVRGAVEPEST